MDESSGQKGLYIGRVASVTVLDTCYERHKVMGKHSSQ